jgi:hypothetical protein
MTAPASPSSRPGLQVGPTSEFTLFIHVKPGQAPSLRESLRALSDTAGYRPGDYPAELEPAEGPYRRQASSFRWNATGRGRQSLRARATDAAGNTQPEVPVWNRLGYGNNAIEVVTVDVR